MRKVTQPPRPPMTYRPAWLFGNLRLRRPGLHRLEATPGPNWVVCTPDAEWDRIRKELRAVVKKESPRST